LEIAELIDDTNLSDAPLGTLLCTVDHQSGLGGLLLSSLRTNDLTNISPIVSSQYSYFRILSLIILACNSPFSISCCVEYSCETIFNVAL
jgi:hypothetical protein